MLSNKPRRQPKEASAPAGATAPVGNPPVRMTAAAAEVQDPLPLEPADPQRQNPFRKIAFYAGLGFLFCRLGVVPELLEYLTRTNFYLLYLFAVPAILGALLTGGVQRTLKSKAAWLWVAFVLWMILAIPFSSWQGGSAGRVLTYVRVDLPILFVLGGMVTTWKEARLTLYTVAAAGFVNLLSANLFTKEDAGGRLQLASSGTIGNSNDLAAHLLLVTPFILFIILTPKRNPVIRVLCMGAIAYSVWVILGTGSRGALVATALLMMYVLWYATPLQRTITVLAGAVIFVGVFTMLPDSVMTRLGSLFGEEHIEAEQSGKSREYLFKQSLLFTVQNPLFGVGPDQFANYEGRTRLEEGLRGNWHATHCAFTQISSECGIPALLFFLGGLWTAMRSVQRTYRQARQQGFKEIANACFCYQAGMVGFLTAITFLANAYTYYLPAMIGLAISMSFMAQREMEKRANPPQPAAAPLWMLNPAVSR